MATYHSTASARLGAIDWLALAIWQAPVAVAFILYWIGAL